MTEPLPVDITAVAAAQIRQAESWWRANRPAAPNAIREELQRAFALIASQPNIGGRASAATLANVRRIHLTRIKYDLYFHLIETTQRTEVVAFWHTRRGSAPPI